MPPSPAPQVNTEPRRVLPRQSAVLALQGLELAAELRDPSSLTHQEQQQRSVPGAEPTAGTRLGKQPRNWAGARVKGVATVGLESKNEVDSKLFARSRSADLLMPCFLLAQMPTTFPTPSRTRRTPSSLPLPLPPPATRTPLLPTTSPCPPTDLKALPFPTFACRRSGGVQTSRTCG